MTNLLLAARPSARAARRFRRCVLRDPALDPARRDLFLRLYPQFTAKSALDAQGRGR